MVGKLLLLSFCRLVGTTSSKLLSLFSAQTFVVDLDDELLGRLSRFWYLYSSSSSRLDSLSISTVAVLSVNSTLVNSSAVLLRASIEKFESFLCLLSMRLLLPAVAALLVSSSKSTARLLLLDVELDNLTFALDLALREESLFVLVVVSVKLASAVAWFSRCFFLCFLVDSDL